jgi:hypothetical protein
MSPDVVQTVASTIGPGTLSSRRRRPWLLIVASLLLAVLAAVLWAKWADSRIRAERLQAEVKAVYAEAEVLRTEAARAQQRVRELERELRELARGQALAARPKAPVAAAAPAVGKRPARPPAAVELPPRRTR